MLFAFSFSLCLETTNKKHNTHTFEYSWRLSIAYCLYTTYVLMNIHKRFDILIYVLVRCACTQTCPLEVRAHIAMLYICCCCCLGSFFFKHCRARTSWFQREKPQYNCTAHFGAWERPRRGKKAGPAERACSRERGQTDHTSLRQAAKLLNRKKQVDESKHIYIYI